MFETTNIATVDFYHLILALLTAFLTAFATTPLVKKLAFRIKAVDVPKDNRRMHKKPMPLIGGLAIFLGFTVSAVVSRLISVDTFRLQFLPLWCGAALIVILGILTIFSRSNLGLSLSGNLSPLPFRSFAES